MRQLILTVAALLMGAASLLWAQTPDANNILYVNNSVPGGNGSGNSWTNAIPQLADALKWARQQNNFTSANPLKIYVARGTYKPKYHAADGSFTTDGGRNNSFVMVNNVQLYGGFNPNGGNTNINTRILLSVSGGAAGTILSGDVNSDDNMSGSGSTLVINGNAENNYHVVIASGAVGVALLDGFSITGGNASSSYGGGMHISSSTPLITHCAFSGNVAWGDASGGGGAVNILSCAPTFRDCSFSKNTCVMGGAICNADANTLFIRCSISQNRGGVRGGGIYNIKSNPTFLSVLITGNAVDLDGGGIYNNNSGSKLFNVTIVNNKTTGIYNDGISSILLQNSILWDATAGSFGGGSYSLIKGSAITTNGNVRAIGLTAADIFTDPANDDYTLKQGSPVIDKGSNTAYTGAGGNLINDQDLAGSARVSGATIDIGAYENMGIAPDVSNTLYVNVNVPGGTKMGNSWENAVPQLADALKWAKQQNNFTPGNPLKIYVAQGTYKPMYSSIDDDDLSPAPADPGNKAFLMVSNVRIYGSFDPATGVTNISQRILPSSGGAGTILSGNIGVPGNNSYHVVVAAGAVGTAVLDGFTIADGKGSSQTGAVTINGIAVSQSAGGGLCNYAASPLIVNCRFTSNSAPLSGGNGGGGIYNDASSPGLVNCTISGNWASNRGGGMSNYNTSSPVLTNCAITDNWAINSGGGMFTYNNSSPVLTNVTMTNNGDNGFDIISGTAIFRNSIIWDMTFVNPGSYSAQYSLIKGAAATANGNVSAGTLTPTDIFANPGGGDYTLKTGSPAINAGSNALFTGLDANTKDLAGNPRLGASVIDMGAYEFGLSPVMYVDASVATPGDGSSWSKAVKTLSGALNAAALYSNINTIYVAQGMYYPTGNQSGADRNAAFLIPQRGGIKIYGGYPGGGGGVSNPKTNPTILSGDIGTPGNRSDNSYHVLVMTGTLADADSVVIDGFTIRDGNANSTGNAYTYNGNATNQSEGGGILMRLNNHLNKVAIRNCIITDNAGSASAGGVYLWQTAPTIVNSLIARNVTAGNGGGLFLYETSGLLLVNSTVTENAAGGNGNSIYNTGASSTKIVNSILWSGDASKNIFNDAALAVTYSNVQQTGGVYTGMGNINADPLFSNPSGADYTLSGGSPAMNKGSNTLFPGLNAETRDLAGNARLAGATIDMGAYENQLVLPVLFGIFSAVIRNGQLIVNWRTETETNNDHFLVQVSSDGRNWKTAQTVQSRAPGGNSTAGLDYGSAIPLTGLGLGAGFLLLGITVGRRRYAFVIAIAVLFAHSFSCSKKDIHKDMQHGKLLIRIVQVDKDGTERVSKVIQAVRE